LSHEIMDIKEVFIFLNLHSCSALHGMKLSGPLAMDNGLEYVSITFDFKFKHFYVISQPILVMHSNSHTFRQMPPCHETSETSIELHHISPMIHL